MKFGGPRKVTVERLRTDAKKGAHFEMKHTNGRMYRFIYDGVEFQYV